MYGLGGLLSNIGTAALSPALTTVTMDTVSDATADWLKDFDWMKEHEGVKDFLSDAAGGTLGSVLSMGLGAGLGALTGGGAGAAGGALTGLLTGGGAAAQHDAFKSAMGLDNPAAQEQVKGIPVADLQQIGNYGTPGVLPGSEPLSGVSTAKEDVASQLAKQRELETPTAKSPILDKDKPGYFSLASGLGAMALPMGMGLTSAMQESQVRKQEEEARKRKAAVEQSDIRSLVNRLYGKPYAEGGMTVNTGGATVKFPDWFIEEYARSGGESNYAHGGYINTQPFDPNTAHPQSQISRATPYAAASPIRNEVVDFERGGLLEGDGDGMSDHIPANIDGKEPVRVADGEFVIPKDIAARFGEKKLEAMLDKVRSAAHAKKGKQIIENAGKRAFIRTLSGVKA